MGMVADPAASADSLEMDQAGFGLPDMPDEWLGTCATCGARALGWNGPASKFFCSGCWGRWQSGGWKAAGPASRRKGSMMLCDDYAKRRRQQCNCPQASMFGCCCPVMWPSLEETVSDDSEDEEITRLSDLTYCDSHCHLEYSLLFGKYGWNIWTFKKWMCESLQKGYCPLGSACEYAHSEAELHVNPPLVDSDLNDFAMAHGFCGDSVASTAPPPERGKAEVREGPSFRGPRLRLLIHNCCAEEAINDTRTLVKASDRFFGGALFCTFGCHPHNWEDYDDALEAKMLENLRWCGSKAVGWGECGLDYYKNFYAAQSAENRKGMVKVFARQARLAVSLGLPLVVHSRDAEEDTMSVLRELPRTHPVHIHSFQGSPGFARDVLEMMPNSMVGLTGVLTMKKVAENMFELARTVPLDRLLLETDAPYLSSDPAFIPKIARKVGQLKGVTTEKVLEHTNRNCQRMYRVGEFAGSRSDALGGA